MSESSLDEEDVEGSSLSILGEGIEIEPTNDFNSFFGCFIFLMLLQHF